MRDRIVVPTFQRPELLWVCLECLFANPEVKDMDVVIYLDNHTNLPSPPINDCLKVIDRYNSSNLKLVVRKPHSYEGNSYNVLTAYVEAYNDGCEHIFEVEDDILVTSDFFEWQYRQFNKSEDWFAVDRKSVV